jgi:AcrR family transcriptional regulator
MPARPADATTPRWQRRPDDRPAALMASALKLVRQQGYRRVRLEDIAADAGVSKATIYHYFTNKDELITRALSERVAERQAVAVALLARSGPSARERLQVFLRHYWEVQLTPTVGVWQRLIVSEIVTDSPPIFRAWAKGLVHRWTVVERLIREGQAAGEFQTGIDTAVAARMIVSSLSYQALFHEHLGVKRLAPCDLDRIFTSAIDQFFAALTTGDRVGPHRGRSTRPVSDSFASG